MNERPILFSAAMVKAILDGRKTQTRRIVRGAPDAPDYRPVAIESPFWSFSPTSDYGSATDVRCPYGAVGDRLWVRETWYCDDYTAPSFERARSGYVGKPPSDVQIIKQWLDAMYYRADTASGLGKICELIPECCCDGQSPWKPGIHMPRWASRIELDVTGVRVERLRDIDRDDAIAEGCCDHESQDGLEQSADEVFRDLWISINGAESWDANVWVWVVEFKRYEAQERAA